MKIIYTLLYIYVGTWLIACSDNKAEQYYQEGRELAEQHRTAEAMRKFHLAIDAGDDGKYVALATTGLGHLYMNQLELGQARDYFIRAQQLADGSDDIACRILARRDLGRLCRAEGQLENALYWFSSADSLITESVADSLYGLVYPEYLSLLITTGKSDKVRQLMHRWHVDFRSGPSCLVAGKFYLKLGQSDSAAYYLERCLENDHLNAHASAAMLLSEVASDADDSELAYAYAMECAVMVDSAKQVMQRENANLVASLSNQMEMERQNSRLQLWLSVLLALFVGLIVATIYFVRWRMERLRRQQEAEQEVRRQQARSRQDELMELFRNTALYRQILAEGTISEKQWMEIELFLDEHANHFSASLNAFYPKIKLQELQTCQLLKLEFTNQQIAAILCKTQQAITNLRKRLYQKMFDREGTAEELNQFLRLFPEK